MKVSPFLDQFYPVGVVYQSTDPTDPAELFGGEWEPIQDVFLLAAGPTHAAGSTGGEESHALTVEEMPSHTHKWRGNDTRNLQTGGADVYRYALFGETLVEDAPGKGPLNAGGDLPHNNMPPYRAVYMWERTA